VSVEDPIVFSCGLDEAGRGPLAGPVCAAAVILSPDFDVSVLNDSKKLSPKKLAIAMEAVYRGSLSWGIGWASAAEIDEINILQASLLAMSRAWDRMFERLRGAPGARDVFFIDAVVDGLHKPVIGARSIRAEPKADGTYAEVMAASILAKTARDRMMTRYSWLYPEYGYDSHMGYPTKAHIEALKQNGPSPIQRNSFRLKGEGQLSLF